MRCSPVLKKSLRKRVSGRMGTLEKIFWILIFLVSIKSNYPSQTISDLMIVTFCPKFMISEQKITNNCPSNTLIFLKSYVWMLIFFCVWSAAGSCKYRSNSGNKLNRKRIYFQKDESSIFKHSVKVFRNSSFTSVPPEGRTISKMPPSRHNDNFSVYFFSNYDP